MNVVIKQFHWYFQVLFTIFIRGYFREIAKTNENRNLKNIFDVPVLWSSSLLYNIHHEQSWVWKLFQFDGSYSILVQFDGSYSIIVQFDGSYSFLVQFDGLHSYTMWWLILNSSPVIFPFYGVLNSGPIWIGYILL